MAGALETWVHSLVNALRRSFAPSWKLGPATKVLASIIAAALWSHGLGASAAEEAAKQSVTTHLSLTTEEAKGAELRSKVNAAAANIRARRFVEAQAMADAVCAQYEALFDRGTTQYSFATLDDLVEFSQGRSEAFEWIDWGYIECLSQKMFIAAENGRFEPALSLSVRIAELAPISAGAALERGYVFNLLKQYDNALFACAHAHELALKYKSQRPLLAASLRGMGVALIDLKRLDEALASFDESLRLEPGNRVALHELDYIRQLRREPK